VRRDREIVLMLIDKVTIIHASHIHSSSIIAQPKFGSVHDNSANEDENDYNDYKTKIFLSALK